MINSWRLIFLASLVFLTGCVTGTRTVELNVPAPESEGVAAGAVYIGEIEDKRVFEQKPRNPSTPSVQGDLASETPETLATYIGRQRNGYGMAFGSIRLANDGTVQDEVRNLLTAGLEARGYNVTEDTNAPIKLSADISRFWAWFTPGFFSVGFSGDVETRLTLEKQGQPAELVVDGKGENRGQVASNANWALAYSRTFSSYLENFSKALDGLLP